MLPQSEFDQILWNFEPHKKLIYRTGMIIQLGLTMIICVGLVSGLSVFIARQLIDPDVSQEALIGVVIIPALMVFLVGSVSVSRNSKAGSSIKHALQTALRDGLKVGMLAGFVVIACWHYIGQLAMTRAIYGALEFHAHPDSYCSLRAALYGVVFAIPVALGCSLFTAVFRIGPQIMLNWVRRLPDHRT